jgi:osmotically-inducible protein OsmY
MGKCLCRKPVVPLIVFVLFIVGCSNSDQDHLARAAGKAREKIKNASGESGRGLTTGWQSVALDARVSARLRWDKTLSDEKIQVQASGGVIELKGTVRDLIQRRRAVELAESTVGAEQVVDLLEVPTQEP